MGNSYKLADSVCGVLLPGPCQQNRQLYLYHCAVKNHTGSNYAGRFFGFFDTLSERGFSLELRDRIFINHPRGICNLQKVVNYVPA
jgi:hypothetical protein